MNVAVIGASDKPDRYSYQAVGLLKEKGHKVFPVHPRVKEIHGIAVYSSVCDIHDKIDTVTMYVGEKYSNEIIEDVVGKSPRKIIFNPGAENLRMKDRAKEKGIETLDACTLVLLRTGRF